MVFKKAKPLSKKPAVVKKPIKNQDAAPKSAEEELQGMPRAARKLMRLQKISQEKQKERQEKPKEAKEVQLKLKKGESLADFGRRVNDSLPLEMIKGVNSVKAEKTAAKQRKKADNLRNEHSSLKRKGRGRSKGGDSDDDDDDEEIKWKTRDSSPDPWEKVNKRNVKPKFGEIADRPPELPTLKKFSNVPKSAGSIARREILEKERENVIKAYRKLKGKESGDAI